MQLHDLGSHTTKVVVRVKFLRALVDSGKGWQAGERYHGCPLPAPLEEKACRGQACRRGVVKMGCCCSIHRRGPEPPCAMLGGWDLSFQPLDLPAQHKLLTLSSCQRMPPAAEAQLNHAFRAPADAASGTAVVSMATPEVDAGILQPRYQVSQDIPPRTEAGSSSLTRAQHLPRGALAHGTAGHGTALAAVTLCGALATCFPLCYPPEDHTVRLLRKVRHSHLIFTRTCEIFLMPSH